VSDAAGPPRVERRIHPGSSTLYCCRADTRPEPCSSALRPVTKHDGRGESMSAGCWKAGTSTSWILPVFSTARRCGVYDPGIDECTSREADPLKQLYRRQISVARAAQTSWSGGQERLRRRGAVGAIHRRSRTQLRAAARRARGHGGELAASMPFLLPTRGRRRGRLQAPRGQVYGQGAPPEAVPSPRNKIGERARNE